MRSFAELQALLGRAWSLNKPGSTVPHVLVALPSFSVGESLLAHYADRIPALEHRYLLARLALHRIEGCEMVFVCSQAPDPAVLDYYTSLAPRGHRRSVVSRFRTLVVPDPSARSVAAKLLDRPELLAQLKQSFQGRPAFIEPWNVTEAEVAVAQRLEAPINGTPPELWPLGYKSAGRRLFAEAGVPTPVGRENVRTVDDVVTAIDAIRVTHPRAQGVVIKHDDSGAGDGNVVIGLADLRSRDRTRAVVRSLPPWYLRDLESGGVVEERIAGARFASPSVQIDVTPFGDVDVLATHEQVLDGETGQVYTGCRFPADPPYAAELGRHGRSVGELLARRGVVGRFSVDFAVTCDPAGRWQVFALEINLRKGGTTHPFAALRNLCPGRYDADAGRWFTPDGTCRWYASTDNLIDDGWRGLPPSAAIRAVARAGLQFDHRTGTGVALHMLACLAIDGRLGLTAIGRSRSQAGELYDAASSAISAAAQGSLVAGP